MYRFVFVIILLVFSTAAKAQDAGAIAKDLANPLASMTSVPFQFNYDNGYGAGDGHKLFVNVQPVVCQRRTKIPPFPGIKVHHLGVAEGCPWVRTAECPPQG